jgi:hypothetical protein
MHPFKQKMKFMKSTYLPGKNCSTSQDHKLIESKENPLNYNWNETLAAEILGRRSQYYKLTYQKVTLSKTLTFNLTVILIVKEECTKFNIHGENFILNS